MIFPDRNRENNHRGENLREEPRNHNENDERFRTDEERFQPDNNRNDRSRNENDHSENLRNQDEGARNDRVRFDDRLSTDSNQDFRNNNNRPDERFNPDNTPRTEDTHASGFSPDDMPRNDESAFRSETDDYNGEASSRSEHTECKKRRQSSRK